MVYRGPFEALVFDGVALGVLVHPVNDYKCTTSNYHYTSSAISMSRDQARFVVKN